MRVLSTDLPNLTFFLETSFKKFHSIIYLFNFKLKRQLGTSQFPLFHSYLLKAEREKERERERERDMRDERLMTLLNKLQMNN